MKEEIKDDWLEFREMPHEMWLEGATDEEPTPEDVKAIARTKDYEANNIRISFDSMQGFWRFSADISKLF